MKIADFPQLDAMRHGVDYHFEITCRNFKVMVRPLTNLEIIMATASAAESYEALPDNQRLTVSSSLLNAMHQLEAASTPDIGELPTLNLALLKHMTPDEVNHLWKQYVRITDKVNPSFESMPVEELEALVEGLKKNSDKLSVLTELSISNLIAVCLHLSQTSPD